MSTLLIGVDAGNYGGKTAGPYGVDFYRTAICDWFERDVVETHGADDMEFEIDGRKGFAGTIATREDFFGVGAMYGESKAHDDTKIRVLLGLYRYLEKYSPSERRLSIVTGQPLKMHKEVEKAQIIEMLRREHVFKVNGDRQRIIIENVGVAGEGAAAYWSSPSMGAKRIIDIGSGTVNCATIIDKIFINTASDSFNFGMETSGPRANLAEIARAIIKATARLKWGKGDTVLVCGDAAVALLPFLQDYFTNAQVISPILRLADGGVEILKPVYANAVGNYEIARLTHGKRKKG